MFGSSYNSDDFNTEEESDDEYTQSASEQEETSDSSEFNTEEESDDESSQSASVQEEKDGSSDNMKKICKQNVMRRVPKKKTDPNANNCQTNYRVGKSTLDEDAYIFAISKEFDLRTLGIKR
jgi:hypothetical protein